MTNNTYIDSGGNEWGLTQELSYILVEVDLVDFQVNLTKDDIIALADLMGLECIDEGELEFGAWEPTAPNPSGALVETEEQNRTKWNVFLSWFGRKIPTHRVLYKAVDINEQ